MTVPTSGAAAATGRQLDIVRERSLRQRLLARDEQALVELVELATPWLLGVAHGMLRDHADAEDVVMETFQVAWQRIETVQEHEAGLMPWLLRVTRNRAIDRLRARRRQLVLVDRAGTVGGFDERATPAVLPNEAAQPGWHVHESVHRAIASLPDDQQDAIQLAYFQGLTQSEIAARLDIPLGTVKTRLRLAFDKLRLSLAGVKDWVV